MCFLDKTLVLMTIAKPINVIEFPAQEKIFPGHCQRENSMTTLMLHSSRHISKNICGYCEERWLKILSNCEVIFVSTSLKNTFLVSLFFFLSCSSMVTTNVSQLLFSITKFEKFDKNSIQLFLKIYQCINLESSCKQ